MRVLGEDSPACYKQGSFKHVKKEDPEIGKQRNAFHLKISHDFLQIPFIKSEC